MHFLVDANMPRSAAALIQRFGHKAVDVRDIGFGGADDSVIALHAKSEKLILLTRDFDFADIRNYPPSQYFGIVVLSLPDDAIATVILDLLERFLSQSELVNKLPGRLAIVESSRVRLRPT